ncbi:unnamed protein product [Dibothriocephalus latus]|uniref:Helix-turn-helix domain-containing protein n=1 Tax=Dibothriocephalus latus TaxID=60516 RepID=A0A3P7L878_DIBLA|nr:unnamed protein product [Dibothriocephalus latus]
MTWWPVCSTQVLTFKERVNSVFPEIQFTMEEEVNNQLAFLDVLVCRKDCGDLKTKVFRKATNTMQVLNDNSNYAISHKRSCAKTLYRRVETHCSELEDKVTEVQYIRRVFSENGYPRNFVYPRLRKRNDQQITPTPNCGERCRLPNDRITGTEQSVQCVSCCVEWLADGLWVRLQRLFSNGTLMDCWPRQPPAPSPSLIFYTVVLTPDAGALLKLVVDIVDNDIIKHFGLEDTSWKIHFSVNNTK